MELFISSHIYELERISKCWRCSVSSSVLGEGCPAHSFCHWATSMVEAQATSLNMSSFLSGLLAFLLLTPNSSPTIMCFYNSQSNRGDMKKQTRLYLSLGNWEPVFGFSIPEKFNTSIWLGRPTQVLLLHAFGTHINKNNKTKNQLCAVSIWHSAL